MAGVYVHCAALVGEAAKAVRARLAAACEEAVARAPSLLLLDDIDALFPASQVTTPAAHGPPP